MAALQALPTSNLASSHPVLKTCLRPFRRRGYTPGILRHAPHAHAKSMFLPWKKLLLLLYWLFVSPNTD